MNEKRPPLAENIHSYCKNLSWKVEALQKAHTKKTVTNFFLHISRFFEKLLVCHLTTRPLFMGWGRCVVWHFVPWKRPSRLFTFYFPYLTFTFWLHVFWNIFSILHLGSFSFYISAPFHELRPLCGSAFCTIELPPSWRSIVGEKVEEEKLKKKVQLIFWNPFSQLDSRQDKVMVCMAYKSVSEAHYCGNGNITVHPSFGSTQALASTYNLPGQKILPKLPKLVKLASSI